MTEATETRRPSRTRTLGALLEHPIANAVWFYLLWMSAVIGKDQWLPLTLSLLVVHFCCVKATGLELRVVFSLAALGVAFDGLLSAFGFFRFENGIWMPVWLVCLWLGFAASLHRSLHYFTRNIIIAIAFGGLGGAFSYWGGMKLGAVTFGLEEPIAVAVLVVAWAIIFPGFAYLNGYLRNAPAMNSRSIS